MSDDGAEGSLFSKWLAEAERERERKSNASNVIGRDSRPAELTEFGLLRWYLHPALEDTSVRSFYFFELEIPPRSRSGKLHHQGNIVHFVAQGSGYTVLDGTAHEWERHDVIALPPMPTGYAVQHFNTGEEPVRLVIAIPNLDSALGPELGVRLEIDDPAPEYLASRK
jgi:hypothetical protein